MKKREVDKILNEGFKTNFELLSFKKIKTGFSKELNSSFTMEFSFSKIDYGSIFPSTFSYRLSCQHLDKIYSKIFNVEKKGLWAYSTGIASLYEDGRYHVPKHEIKSEEDAHKMVREVTQYMKETAIPYLESISNIEALNKVINTNNTNPYTYQKGLIFAKLADNPNYEVLKKQYRQGFVDKNWAVKEDIDKFETTIIFLEQHSKEELEEIVGQSY